MLGGHVGKAAYDVVHGAGLGAVDLGDAEINQFDRSVSHYHQVLGLDVAMHNRLGLDTVSKLKGLSGLEDDRDFFDEMKLPARTDDLAQGLSRQELHDKVGLAG